ncbi:MBL fold metallo-hydrolase [Georgenia sp. TF02-10]|uniref:MBL fold metallo-hydrolase n=1 Tax=Georgenia sp. TF02-10 TaxID=2917725 RepID=UPI001FA7CA8D|nr:MBL fold metallo-hydrolase [Georgenia sp. TF02-10]UNX53683.1 MBL fold metallo-hydrolase [Georgenia sp. TF02-10]
MAAGARPVSERVAVVRAPNPGPMTLEGTNTYLLRDPASTEVLVVDPGPDDAGHVRAVLAAATADGGRVTGILLTHHHPDHTGAVGALVAATSAPVLGGGATPLGEGTVPGVGGPRVEVMATPGHTADSVCLLVPADRVLLTGDTVLGRGPTVIAPDGDLGDYLTSLNRLLSRQATGDLDRIAPGHGPQITDAGAALTALREHRQRRLAQVSAALAAGAQGVDDVLDAVYGDIEPELRTAAASSVRAQLTYLARR